MKRKKMKIFIPVFLLIIILVVIILKKNMVNMDFAERGEAIYKNYGLDIQVSLSDQDMHIICDIFSGKILYRDNPSCGFGEDAAIKFNDEQTFCIACDTCPVVYWKEKNKYIRLKEDEKTQLYNLLEPYGFRFPCV